MLAAFGKIASEADFVRVSPSSSNFAWIDAWSRSTHEVEPSWPIAPIFFLRPVTPTGHAWTAGMLVPSRDAVGRRFPLAVFASFDFQPSQRYCELPKILSPFFASLTQLTNSIETLDLSRLQRELAELRHVNPYGRWPLPDLRASGALPPAASILEHMIGKSFVEGLAYARVMLQAARTRSHANPAQTTLLAPAASDLALFGWLELIRLHLVGQPSRPTILWSESFQRVLVALGDPPPRAGHWLENQQADNPKLWPLVHTDATVAQRVGLPMQPDSLRVVSTAGDDIERLLAQIGEYVGQDVG